MKRIIIRILAVAALILICFGGTLSLMRVVGSSDLERYKRKLRAKGEKLSISELAPGPVTPNPLLPRLVEANKHLPDSPISQGDLSPMDATNGFAQPAWTCPTNPWALWRTQLDDSAVHLSEIRAAIKLKPQDFGWNYVDYAGLPKKSILEIRTAAQWLGSAVLIDLNRQRKTESLTNLIALIELAQCHEHEGTFGFQMIRIALAQLVVHVLWETLQAPMWSDSELQQLQDACQQVDLGRPLLFSLRIERATGLNYFAMARRGDTNATDFIRLSKSSEGPDVYTGFWRMALSPKDERVFLEIMQGFVEALDNAVKARSGRELDDRLNSDRVLHGRLASYRYPMSYAATPSVIGALKRWVRTETLRQLALAAIGLERYRLRHGRYPERLEELVPDILPAVPVDFGDGKPLRYKRAGEKYELWSVWEDLRWPMAK